jgi:hypothetical protein
LARDGVSKQVARKQAWQNEKKNFLARDGILSDWWPGLSSFKCHKSTLNSIANRLDLADEFARAISYEPYFDMIYDN